MTVARVKPALKVALKEGVCGTKYSFADIVFADQRTIQRYLRDLHREGFVRISGYAYHYKQLIPIYSLQSQEFPLQDAKPPKKVSAKVAQRKYRAANPEFCIRQNAKKRQKRAEQKCREVPREEIAEWLSALRLIRASTKKERKRK